MSAAALGAAALIAAAFVTDIRTMRIPNLLTGAGFLLGLGYHGATAGWNGAGSALAGAAAGFVPLFLLHLMKGIGAGDVKLFGALGAWLGVYETAQLLMYSILYAGAIGCIVIAASRPFARRLWTGIALFIAPGRLGMKKEVWNGWAAQGLKFPFMLAVAPAAVTLWW